MTDTKLSKLQDDEVNALSFVLQGVPSPSLKDGNEDNPIDRLKNMVIAELLVRGIVTLR